MSKIEQLVKNMESMEDYCEQESATKIPVTIRLDEVFIWRLDTLLKKFKGTTRTGMSKDLLETALIEALEVLGYEEESQIRMYIKDKKQEAK